MFRYVVCEYYPPGNFGNEYQTEVQGQVKCETDAPCSLSSAAPTVRPTLFSTSMVGTPSPTATSTSAGCSARCVLSALGLRGVWLGIGLGVWMTL